jgi:Protein of unknown function (DUF2917)
MIVCAAHKPGLFLRPCNDLIMDRAINQCAMRMYEEVDMQHVLDVRPVNLPARSVHRIEGGKGLQITSVAGTVWVTQADDPRDIVLGRGRSFILDRKGVAVVYGLSDASIVIGPAGHITPADFAPAEARSA